MNPDQKLILQTNSLQTVITSGYPQPSAWAKFGWGQWDSSQSTCRHISSTLGKAQITLVWSATWSSSDEMSFIHINSGDSSLYFTLFSLVKDALLSLDIATTFLFPGWFPLEANCCISLPDLAHQCKTKSLPRADLSCWQSLIQEIRPRNATSRTKSAYRYPLHFIPLPHNSTEHLFTSFITYWMSSSEREVCANIHSSDRFDPFVCSALHQSACWQKFTS